MDYNVAAIGACIALRQVSDVTIENSFFRNNLATDQIGVLLVDLACSAEIRNSHFIENIGTQLISVLKSNRAERVLIDNCDFIDNFAGAIMMQIQSSTNIIISDSRFLGNTAVKDTPGIYLLSSIVQAIRVEIHQDKSTFTPDPYRRMLQDNLDQQSK